MKPDYSGNPFSEYTEYSNAIKEREKDILAYRDEKIGKKYKFLDYPKRACIQSDNSGEKEFYHISRQYYAHDYTKRILISGNEDNDLIIVIFQTAINATCE